MARPTKLTPERQARLIEAIEQGQSYDMACHYAGIVYETFRVWMHTKPAFSAAIKKAESEALQVWLSLIQRAANDGDWQAAAWKAERRYPHIYGRTVQQHSGELTVHVRYVTDWRAPIHEGEGGNES